MDVVKTRGILQKLAEKGLLVDVERDGEPEYTLPLPMAGFFEFSLMRVRTDIDQKALSELFFQYINVEEDFIKNMFSSETQLGRVYVNEDAIARQPSLEVLDHDKVSAFVDDASAVAVGLCYCRYKMSHVGKACENRQDNCITLNSAAESLIRHGFAKSLSKAEAHAVFQAAREARLVQFGENVREGVNFICNCCKCCCEGMVAARRFGWLHPVQTTPFQPEVITDTCVGCGKCSGLCPIEAIHVSPEHPLSVNHNVCLGCGFCVTACPRKALILHPRPHRILTPANTTHRVVLQAIERGMLQNLIFDCQAFQSHRAMAAILGVILSLPPPEANHGGQADEICLSGLASGKISLFRPKQDGK